ncbi:conjugal transfer protein TraR [Salmonella enterica]|uniref:conjugal transfer protein TraR n=1 Tax=Salmonella enterica TaxID=28901 RepID=UPI002F261B5C
MADVLDQLQEQEDLIHRLHIQAVRQQLSVKGESLTRCECCGNCIQERRQKAIPGVRTCTECQRVPTDNCKGPFHKVTTEILTKRQAT